MLGCTAVTKTQNSSPSAKLSLEPQLLTRASFSNLHKHNVVLAAGFYGPRPASFEKRCLAGQCTTHTLCQLVIIEHALPQPGYPRSHSRMYVFSTRASVDTLSFSARFFTSTGGDGVGLVGGFRSAYCVYGLSGRLAYGKSKEEDLG